MFEGGEGSGKSTQARLLAGRLGRETDREVILTFEPGATARGSRIRALLLDDESPLDSRAELLMMAADRAQHCGEVIGPALDRGAIVICDRFEPSSIAYQGIGRGLGVDVVATISGIARGSVVPDLVLVLDVTDETAAQRRPTATDRIEKAGTDFHARVRTAYRDLAATYSWQLIDGADDVDAVHDRVWECVRPLVDIAGNR